MTRGPTFGASISNHKKPQCSYIEASKQKPTLLFQMPPNAMFPPESIGRWSEPRTIWSDLRGSMPRLTATSMLSVNFALLVSFARRSASSSGWNQGSISRQVTGGGT
eukprot:EG_transcript_55823